MQSNAHNIAYIHRTQGQYDYLQGPKLYVHYAASLASNSNQSISNRCKKHTSYVSKAFDFSFRTKNSSKTSKGWASLGKFGQGQASLESLGKLGQVWTSLD